MGCSELRGSEGRLDPREQLGAPPQAEIAAMQPKCTELLLQAVVRYQGR